MTSAHPNTRWLPLTYDANSDCFLFAAVDVELLGQATFLDQRMGAAWEQMQAIPASRIGLDHATPAAPAWIFHTAFCCSTLLARALHAPPTTIALKEPHALMALTQLSMREAGLPPKRLEDRLRQAIELLSQPWSPGGRVLIKPTNAVNRLLPRLLQLAPSSRAVLLHSGLENFLVSCCKKLPSAETPVRWMAEYLLPGTKLEEALQIPSAHHLNFVEACVLTWHAQIEIYADALKNDERDQLRTLDMQALLARPKQATLECARWLGLDAHASSIDSVFSRDSKKPEASHGSVRRNSEQAAVMARYGDLIRSALAWNERVIAPCAESPRDWKPLPV